MAGNTKFMGFTPDGMVKLFRWGGDAFVEVSKESLEALRTACYNGLPKSPPKQRTGFGGARVDYDETQGLINVTLSPDDAEMLKDVLEHGSVTNGVKFADDLSADLGVAVQAHHDYINTEGEPGVEERPN